MGDWTYPDMHPTVSFFRTNIHVRQNAPAIYGQVLPQFEVEKANWVRFFLNRIKIFCIDVDCGVSSSSWVLSANLLGVVVASVVG
jgi:hypothetical protein